MMYAFLSRLKWFLTFIFLIGGLSNCTAGKNIKYLEYEKVFGGPPYSAREKKAEDLISHYHAERYGAVKIGSFSIIAYNLDEANEIAAEEAAKLGADYYWIDPEPYQHTKKRYVIDGITSTTIGNQRITTERYHYDDISVKGVYDYYCEIYRIGPTKKLRSEAVLGCLSYCTNMYSTVCPERLLADCLRSDIKIKASWVVSWFACLVETPKPRQRLEQYRSGLEEDYKKLELILNRGLINPDGYYSALQILRGKKYSLEDFKKPDKPKRELSLSESLDYDAERQYPDVLKLHSDFLKKVETALTGYKLPEPTNYIEHIKAKVTKIQFFESGYSLPKNYKKVYAKVFKSSDTRYIWWELNMECPPLEREELISLKSVIRTVDGKVYGRTTRSWRIFPKTTWFWVATSWGAKNTGTWKPGTYSVELYINGDFTAIDKFMVN